MNNIMLHVVENHNIEPKGETEYACNTGLRNPLPKDEEKNESGAEIALNPLSVGRGSRRPNSPGGWGHHAVLIHRVELTGTRAARG